MHKPGLQRLGRADDPVAHEEVHRLRHTQELDEQVLAAFVRHQAEAQRAAAQPRLSGCDAKVAGERQGKACLDSDAVNRGDGELVQIAYCQVERLGQGAEPIVRPDWGPVAAADLGYQRCGPLAWHGAARYVVAGGESSPGAGEDHHPHRVVHLGLEQRLHQVPLHLLGHPVEPLRLIEGDESDAGVVQR